MYIALLLVAALIAIGVALLAGVSAGVKPSMTRRAFVFLALAALPGLWTMGLLVRADSTMKSVGFCLRCHEMEPFGESLHSSDQSLLAASHYQNAWVPQDRACYGCHTEDTLEGEIDAKIKGMDNLRIHYFGSIPEAMSLRKPYDSRICTSCHGESSLEKQPVHPPDLFQDVKAGGQSCLTCHGPAHFPGG
jgi:cytochrome c-type protein NapC